LAPATRSYVIPSCCNSSGVSALPSSLALPRLASMNRFGLKFNHLGLATAQPEKTARFLDGLGYAIGPTIHDPLQKVNLILCQSAAMPTVEIISPAGEPGPLDKILADQSERIYHLCYESDESERSLSLMKTEGHRVVCLSPPTPAVLFGYRRVSFYLIKGFGMIEIIEPGA